MAVGAKLRYEVLRRDNYACRFCGASAPGFYLEIDHVVPRSAGGSDQADNLQVLCADCNAGKSAAMPERWLVREVKKAARRRWEPAEATEDDFTEMLVYLDARFDLEALPSDTVLACITHVMANVYPYKPDESELIIAAAKYARERVPAPGSPG